ncbi:hypothetical protein CDV31_004441 [Fusarium ambrosium]|uniref:Uncharacterized protein n=1 Tax=Fusarium ambrosium TaxID=131363 RepID=A0A428UQX1_9HYPO|nr:hypothetical protein CDV31_004441 [Fusarium ambrosium]
MNSMGSRVPCPSVDGPPRSGAATPELQLADFIDSIASKKQVATNETRQPSSAEPILHRSIEDALNKWDTSSVNALNRQVILETITPPRTKGQFLETIPEALIGIETPSPDNDKTPFGAAKIKAPSRSYSPTLSRRNQLGLQSSMDELDIHPVLRSNC